MSFPLWLPSLRSRFTTASAPRNHRRTRRYSLALERLESRLAPATLVVNTNADAVNPADGALSLRDAITAINAGNTNGLTAGEKDQVSGTFGVNDTIEFSSVLNGDTITLNGTALPELAKSMTITGPGAGNLTINGNNQGGVFTVAGDTTVSISGLTIAFGNSSQPGGGIFNEGTLTVNNATLAHNSATYGGGIFNEGTLTVNNSTFVDNSASYGGGIHNDSTLTVSNCTLADNSASQYGGGISNYATLTVNNSTLADNSAPYGQQTGGGIWNIGTVTVNNSTLADNSASKVGGGIANENGGSTTLNNTIVAGSTSGGDLSGSVFSGAYDLTGDGSDLGSFSDSLQGNPLLAPLGNYGGPTQTMALLPGSPALRNGLTQTSTTVDQRGFARPVNSPSDVGAFQSGPLVVNTTADSDSFGLLTLRDALAIADADITMTALPITFDPTVFASSQTITLTGGTLTLGGSSTVAPITITGPSAGNLAISGNNQGGVFTVAGDTTVSISGLTIANGSTSQPGGGIYNAGTLTVNNSTLTDNVSSNLADGGGGIYNAGTLTVNNSTLADNSASQYGGGIANSATLTVNNSTLAHDSATYGGGGISGLAGCTATVSNSTLVDNSATYGGGIFGLVGCTVTVSNSTLADNQAPDGVGGGIWNEGTVTVSNSTLADNSASYGGGIYSDSTLTVSNSTLADNSASQYGGGIANYATLTVNNSTVADNSASGGDGGGIANEGGSATLNNTIVAGSTSGGDLSGSVFSGAYDLIGDGSDLGSFSDSLQGNPLLAPLGNYGGPTQTMALLPGSPALDAGSVPLAVDANGNPLTTDQRGQPRLLNGTVDLGAFESQGFTLTATSGSNQTALFNASFAEPLVVTVTANNAVEPVDGGVVTFTVPAMGASATLSTDLPSISAGQVSVPAQANDSAGSYTITASISSAGTPADFTLTNEAVALNAIRPQTVADGSTLSFTVTATSANGSPESLTFSLGAGAPAGAGIIAQTGQFTWAPSEWNGITPGVYTLTISAAETNNPQLASTATFSVTVGPSSTNQGSGATAQDNINMRTAVAAGIDNSQEYYTDLLDADYLKYVNRLPTQAELTSFWYPNLPIPGQASAGADFTDQEIEAYFIGSPEYIQDNGGTDALWIASMYESILGRPAQQTEINYWLNQKEADLNSGLSVGDADIAVAKGIVASNASESILVGADYTRYLGRSGSATEIAYWVNLFQTGYTNEQVIAGFVGSQEFFQDHGSNIVDWLFADYKATLNRLPDQNGFTYWENQLQ